MHRSDFPRSSFAGLLLFEEVLIYPNNKVKEQLSHNNSTAIMVHSRITWDRCRQGYQFTKTSRAAFYLFSKANFVEYFNKHQAEINEI